MPFGPKGKKGKQRIVVVVTPVRGTPGLSESMWRGRQESRDRAEDDVRSASRQLEFQRRPAHLKRKRDSADEAEEPEAEFSGRKEDSDAQGRWKAEPMEILG